MSDPIKIKVEGVEQAIADLRAWELRKRGALSRAVALTLIEGTTHIKRLISRPGPSSPGDPPGVDTGRLRASYRHRMDGLHNGEVYTETEYAPFLEYGTAKMAPRPHAGPTSAHMSGRFLHHAKGALSD